MSGGLICGNCFIQFGDPFACRERGCAGGSAGVPDTLAVPGPDGGAEAGQGAGVAGGCGRDCAACSGGSTEGEGR